MIDDYELITYIDDNGVALDDHGHEFRDENGQLVIIPLNERRYFKTIERVQAMYTVTYKTYMGGVESYAYRRFTNRANATTFARKTGGTIEKA